MVVHSLGTFVYAPPECWRDDLTLLPDEEAHHLRHVLRAQAGIQLYATDGAGLVHRCTVADKNQLKIEETIHEFGEPPVHITLAVGILKGDGNRDIVDSATQLGAREIVFLQAARSEGSVSGNKLARLQRVAVSAIKQCGRARLPLISTVDSVAASLKLKDETTRVLLAQQLDENSSETRSAEARHSFEHVMIYVGPEGGFDAAELKLLQDAGAEFVHLGRRRLRTAVAANAALSYCLRMIGETG